MGWGEAPGVTLTPEQMRDVRTRAVAARNLAERTRDYIRRPHPSLLASLEAALANYDETVK